MASTPILTPVGRLVAGSLYRGFDKDAEGKPLVIKSGPNAGQPKLKFFFALAIPKIVGQSHWAQVVLPPEIANDPVLSQNPKIVEMYSWGAKIWAAGHTAFPVQAQHPSFAWKVEDGDSQIPNRKGRKPCENEGWPGHWVLMFSSGFPPKIYNNNGTEQLLQPDHVKPGYYIQVSGSVDGNGSQQQPGVFLNHSMVALVGFGPEISLGLDAASVGFGAAPLPAGASATPVAGAFNPAAPAAVAPPQVPAARPPVPTPAPAPVAALVPVPAVAVAPNPAFLQPQAAQAPVAPPAAPAPVAPPAAPAGPVMTPKANGTPYASFIQAGWTHAQLVAEGYVLG